MVNPGTLLQAVVDLWRDIPALVSEVGDAAKIFPYFDRYATKSVLTDQIFRISSPGVMLCWDGKSAYRSGGEYLGRVHRFCAYVRLKESPATADGSDCYTLLDLLEAGVPANGDGLPMLYTNIHDDCDSIGDPMDVSRVSVHMNAQQEIDYFAVKFSIRERGPGGV